MGAFTQIDGPDVSAPTPQTGINPNPSSVSYGVQMAQPAGKGGSNVTYSSTSGQPSFGVLNQYSNTVQSGDNRNISGASRGKGI